MAVPARSVQMINWGSFAVISLAQPCILGISFNGHGGQPVDAIEVVDISN